MELTSAFWGAQGRVGRIQAGPWVGRFVFAYPDPLDEWWTVVIDPPPVEGVPGDDYYKGNDVIVEVNAAWNIQWLPRGAEEEQIEREHFGWRPLRSRGVDWLPSSLPRSAVGSDLGHVDSRPSDDPGGRMLVDQERKFARMAASLDHLGSLRFDPPEELDLPHLTDADLRFGYFLGVLSDSAAVRLATEQRVAGHPQTRFQESLSDVLSDDLASVDALMRATGDPDDLATSPASRTWFMIFLDLSYRKWERGLGDIQLELAHFLDAWWQDGEDVWRCVQPRGWDALLFGNSARRRMLARLREYLDDPTSRTCGARS